MLFSGWSEEKEAINYVGGQSPEEERPLLLVPDNLRLLPVCHFLQLFNKWELCFFTSCLSSWAQNVFSPLFFPDSASFAHVLLFLSPHIFTLPHLLTLLCRKKYYFFLRGCLNCAAPLPLLAYLIYHSRLLVFTSTTWLDFEPGRLGLPVQADVSLLFMSLA